MSNITQEKIGQERSFARLGTQVIFDEHIYDSGSKHEGYHSSVHPIDHLDDDDEVDLFGRNPSCEDANVRSSYGTNDENDALIDTSNQRKVPTDLLFVQIFIYAPHCQTFGIIYF